MPGDGDDSSSGLNKEITMKTKRLMILLLGLCLVAGCDVTEKSDPTMETAVISCEAAHVTLESLPSGLEKLDANE